MRWRDWLIVCCFCAAFCVLFCVRQADAAVSAFSPQLATNRTQGTAGGVSGNVPTVLEVDVRTSTCTDDVAGGPCDIDSDGYPVWFYHPDGITPVMQVSGAAACGGNHSISGRPINRIDSLPYGKFKVCNAGALQLDVWFLDPYAMTAYTETRDFHFAAEGTGLTKFCYDDDSTPTCTGGTGVNVGGTDLSAAVIARKAADTWHLFDTSAAWTISNASTFQINADDMVFQGNGGTATITATYSNSPIITCSGSRTGNKFVDLDLDFSSAGGSNEQPIIRPDGGECSDILVWGLTADGDDTNRTISNLWFGKKETYIAANRQLATDWNLVDVTARHFRGVNGIMGHVRGLGLINTSIRNTTNNAVATSAEHTVRFVSHRKVFIYSGDFGEVSDNRHALTARAFCDEPSTCAQLADLCSAASNTQDYCTESPSVEGPIFIGYSRFWGAASSDNRSVNPVTLCQDCGNGCSSGGSTPNFTTCSHAILHGNIYAPNDGTDLISASSTAWPNQKIGPTNLGYRHILSDSDVLVCDGATTNGCNGASLGGNGLMVNCSMRNQGGPNGRQGCAESAERVECSAAWSSTSGDNVQVCANCATVVEPFESIGGSNPYDVASVSDPPDPSDIAIAAGSPLAGACTQRTRSVIDVVGRVRDWDNATNYDIGAYALTTSSLPSGGATPDPMTIVLQGPESIDTDSQFVLAVTPTNGPETSCLFDCDGNGSHESQGGLYGNPGAVLCGGLSANSYTFSATCQPDNAVDTVDITVADPAATDVSLSCSPAGITTSETSTCTATPTGCTPTQYEFDCDGDDTYEVDGASDNTACDGGTLGEGEFTVQTRINGGGCTNVTNTTPLSVSDCVVGLTAVPSQPFTNQTVSLTATVTECTATNYAFDLTGNGTCETDNDADNTATAGPFSTPGTPVTLKVCVSPGTSAAATSDATTTVTPREVPNVADPFRNSPVSLSAASRKGGVGARK